MSFRLVQFILLKGHLTKRMLEVQSKSKVRSIVIRTEVFVVIKVWTKN